MSADSQNASLAQTHRLMMAALMGAPVMIVLVVSFVLEMGEPDPVYLAILLVVGVAIAAAIPAVGYRMPPLGAGVHGDAARDQAMARYQASAMVRFALAEAPVLIGVVLGFLDASFVPCLLGGAISVVLMLLHVWPSRRVIERSAEILESQGVDSGLRRTFGYA